jgi:hypothetical protein
MGNAFYDGECQQEYFEPTRRAEDRRIYQRILTGFHKRKVCIHAADLLSSEMCVCEHLISKIIVDNPAKTKRRLVEMYAVDELGNYNYCYTALIKHFDKRMLHQVRNQNRLKASRTAPEGYRVVSADLVHKYDLHDFIVRKDDDSYVQYSKHPPISYLLEIPD